MLNRGSLASGPLTGSPRHQDGTPSSEFVLDASGTCQDGLVLAPGATCQFRARLAVGTGASIGQRHASLVLQANPGGNGAASAAGG